MLGVSVFLCLGVPCPGTIVVSDLPLIGGMAMLVFAGGFSVAVNVGTTGVTAVVETTFRESLAEAAVGAANSIREAAAALRPERMKREADFS
ncbi:MAG: hypothetical protein R3F31_04490 [Verrucomicrobiales bacterium]